MLAIACSAGSFWLAQPARPRRPAVRAASNTALNTDLLQCQRKVHHVRRVVHLAAEHQATRPRIDGGNGIGGRGFALLVHTTATSGNITITGTNNNNLQISGTTGLMLISVCANLANGITVCANMTGVTNTQRPVSPSIKGITISPNPNNGIFFINVDSFKASAAATLYDITGKEIAAYNLRKGENKIEKENLAAGTYVVKLAIDGTTESRQIIIK